VTSAVVVPVLAASLVGSLHCAGMCGPFVAFYAGGDTSKGASRALSHLAYHAGRLATYATLGAVAGAVGSAVDLAGRAAGVGRVASFAAGAAMIVWATVLLLEHVGVRGLALRAPARLRSFAVDVIRKLEGRPPVARAGLLGFCSTLLPCGWLYAFAVVAAGTGSALGGALVMLSFWAGTVPLLLGVGLGAQSIAGRLRRHVPVVSALALLMVGLAAVLGRVNVPSLAARNVKNVISAEGIPSEPPCHHPGAQQ
jgi:sulfite exporter TauE/SafE